jgi:hypothetical protein
MTGNTTSSTKVLPARAESESVSLLSLLESLCLSLPLALPGESSCCFPAPTPTDIRRTLAGVSFIEPTKVSDAFSVLAASRRLTGRTVDMLSKKTSKGCQHSSRQRVRLDCWYSRG